jgi:hypothetical protein
MVPAVAYYSLNWGTQFFASVSIGEFVISEATYLRNIIQGNFGFDNTFLPLRKSKIKIPPT